MTTSESARLLLAGQLRALKGIDWTIVSGDVFENVPAELHSVQIPMRRDPSLSDPMSFLQLWWFLVRNRFDFVQTHTPKASLLGLPAARLAGTVALYTMHGSLYFRGNRRARNVAGWLFEKWCSTWANGVLLQSAEDQEVLPSARICKATKLTYVGNGIDLERFLPVAPKGEGHGLTVLMISRLVAEKGCHDFFELARRLHSQAAFVHVGPMEHDQRDAIDGDEVSGLEKAGVVSFAGEVTDVRAYIEQADIVLLPSYREGIPRAAMEAAAMGRPVAAYDIRGVREVIPEEGGLLVPPGDVDALEIVVAGLIRNRSARLSAGVLCRSHVRARFSEVAVVERLRGVYQDVVTQP